MAGFFIREIPYSSAVGIGKKVSAEADSASNIRALVRAAKYLDYFEQGLGGAAAFIFIFSRIVKYAVPIKNKCLDIF